MGHRSATAAALVAILLIGVAQTALANGYVGIQGHLLKPTTTHNDNDIEAGSEGAPGASLVVGTEVTPWLRTEAELAWKRSFLHGYNHGSHQGYDRESAEGTVDMAAGLVNAWVQAPGGVAGFRPYVGGGAGVGVQRLDGLSAVTKTKMEGTSVEPSWQLGAGVQKDIGPVTLDLGVRHFEGGDVQNNGLVIGLTYSWGA